MRISDWSSDVCSSDLFGIAKQVLVSPEEQIEVPGLGDRPNRQVKRQALGAVVEPRIEELFTFVQQIVRESGYEDLLASGVVLTGGTALMPGIVELAEDVFLKPVRVAVPAYEGSLADVMHNPRSEEHTSELQSLMRISY